MARAVSEIEEEIRALPGRPPTLQPNRLGSMKFSAEVANWTPLRPIWKIE
jgi:hypothetical protein